MCSRNNKHSFHASPVMNDTQDSAKMCEVLKPCSRQSKQLISFSAFGDLYCNLLCTVKTYIMADRGMSFWDWWSIKIQVYDTTESDREPDFVEVQRNGSPYLQTRGWRCNHVNRLDCTTYMWTSKDYPSTRHVSANMLMGTTSSRIPGCSRISELSTVTETEID